MTELIIYAGNIILSRHNQRIREVIKAFTFTPPDLSTGILVSCPDKRGLGTRLLAYGKSCHIFCKRLAAVLSEKRNSHTAK